MALLEASGIGKNFEETHVLKDISLTLEKGEALAIIGSSGSGKTTLLRCLNFLEKPDKGKIVVQGETLFDAEDATSVKEKDIRLIQRLSEVEVRLTAMPDVPVKGTVYHISELLDPETRSVEVLIECDNRDHRMKPYMYGTVQLTDAATEAMLVPTSAILQQEESCYVLVCEGANRFRKAEVTTASTDGDRTVVLSGVRPGEEIVTGGAFYLLDAR